MGMCIVQDRWHSFIPSAPNLVFQIPTYNFDGQRSLQYEYVYDADSPKKYLDAKMFDYPNFTVKVNHVTWSWYYTFNTSEHSIEFESYRSGGQYTPLPPDGSTITIRAFDGQTSADRFYHLDLSANLIQGAVPFEQSILDSHHQFQGGSRLNYVALGLPKFGTMRYCESKMGFDYQPPLGFEGVDSFPYYLETQFGQRSDAACITIEVGNVDIGE